MCDCKFHRLIDSCIELKILALDFVFKQNQGLEKLLN
jgi:hypothetical protein